MDLADRSQIDSDIHLTNAIQAARTLPGATRRVSRNFCAACEEPIPVARREAVPGCQLCIPCQGAAEGRGDK